MGISRSASACGYFLATHNSRLVMSPRNTSLCSAKPGLNTLNQNCFEVFTLICITLTWHDQIKETFRIHIAEYPSHRKVKSNGEECYNELHFFKFNFIVFEVFPFILH